MVVDPTLTHSFSATVDWIYAGLVRNANIHITPGRECGLGGQLLYAGELDGAGSALVVASNIAGAASLSASADVAAQKQAIRDGVIDFLVTTLTEAVRILKNEVRKCQPVAVCVSQSPDEIEWEMAELGIRPDLLPPGVLDAPRYRPFLDQGATQVDPRPADISQTVVTWTVSSASSVNLPKLDIIARDCLTEADGPDEWASQRWLRLHARYLGRFAQGIRLLRCNSNTAQAFLDKARERVEIGEIPVAVDFCLSRRGKSKMYPLLPPQSLESQAELTASSLRPRQSSPKVQ